MKISKFFAFSFLMVTTFLTINYFIINGKVMNQEYHMCLSAFSALNIITLALVIFEFPQDFDWRLVFLMMFIGSICKALFDRSIPGTHLDDFIFTVWKFNDSWSYITKVIWHVSLDWLVLFIILGIKNSYKLFEKKS